MNSRERRVVIAGLGIVAAALFLRLAGGAGAKLRTEREIVVAEALALEGETALVLRADSVEADARSSQRALVELAPSLVPGGSRLEAATTLASHLEAAAVRHRVRLDRSDAVDDSAAIHRLRAVTLDVVAVSDLRGITALLQDLESGSPSLGLERIRLLSGNPSAQEHEPEEIRAELRIRGWYLAAKE